MTGTKLLIPEPPLQVLPRLAARIGLNEAMLLQQLHYWTVRGKGRDGGWVYNTLAGWRGQFPFWSEDTIKRGWASLREQGLVEIEQRRGSDRTNSYRIVEDGIPTVQVAPFMDADCPDGEGKLPSSLEQAETTQEKQTSAKADRGQVEAVFDFWATTLKKRNPKLSEKRKRKVEQRLKEGFTPEEITAAIVGLTYSPHHMGENGSPRKYDDLELICRDPEHLESFRDLYLEKKGKGSGESAGDRQNRQRREALAEREATS